MANRSESNLGHNKKGQNGRPLPSFVLFLEIPLARQTFESKSKGRRKYTKNNRFNNIVTSVALLISKFFLQFTRVLQLHGVFLFCLHPRRCVTYVVFFFLHVQQKRFWHVQFWFFFMPFYHRLHSSVQRIPRSKAKKVKGKNSILFRLQSLLFPKGFYRSFSFFNFFVPKCCIVLHKNC